MATLKQLAQSNGAVVSEEALSRTLSELKIYITTRAALPVQQIQDQLNALIGAQGGDTDKLLNTFNDIKAFLADYDEDNTLKSLIDAVGVAISSEQTRAQGVETALSTRIGVLESVGIMTSEQAKTLFDSIYNPDSSEEGGD